MVNGTVNVTNTKCTGIGDTKSDCVVNNEMSKYTGDNVTNEMSDTKCTGMGRTNSDYVIPNEMSKYTGDTPGDNVTNEMSNTKCTGMGGTKVDCMVTNEKSNTKCTGIGDTKGNCMVVTKERSKCTGIGDTKVDCMVTNERSNTKYTDVGDNQSTGAFVGMMCSPFLSSYVSLQIEKHKVFAMLDSGADVTCINPKMMTKYKGFHKYKVHVSDREYVETAGGERIPTQGMVFMKAKLDGANVQCKFYLVPGVQPDFILGRDFLCFNKVTMQFSQKGISVSVDPRRQLVAESTVTIPPKSQAVLIARIRGAPLPHEVIGVTSGSPNLFSLGLLPTKSLSVNKHGSIQYGCANFTTEPIVIAKGANIGKFTCLSQRHEMYMIPEDNQLSNSESTGADYTAVTCTNNNHQCDHMLSMCKEECPNACPSVLSEQAQTQFQSSRSQCAQINSITSEHRTTGTGIDPHTHNLSQKLDLSKTDLSDVQKGQMKDLVDKYHCVFVGSDDKLGKCDILQHKIEIDPKHKPIRHRCYRLGPKQKDVLETMIHDMQDQEIIQPSVSPWAAPCLLVAKPNNRGYRFVVDFRGINKLIELQACPLPTTEETLESIGTSNPTYFTTLDLQSGFYQIAIDPQSSQYTAFRCHLGLYEFKRLPMGLRNSPSIFQRVMEAVLHGLTWKHCLVYMDDVCIFSTDFDTHLQHIEEVFSRLADAGLKLRLDKCKFAARKISYLGHEISSDGISPNPDRVAAVKEYPVPKTLKDLRAFLGLSGYYRKFIKSYAAISAPLYALTKKGAAYIWSSECDIAFNKLKSALTSPPVLAYPDFSKPFRVYTDASSFAVGGVLAQEVNGVERVNCYVGRSLNSAERNYGITEKECLALVYSVRKLDCYLRYSSFTAIVDHSALKWLFSLKEPTGKFARWIALLQAYDFVIEYRPGQVHQNADGVSRREYDTGVDTDGDYTLIGPEFEFNTPAAKPAGHVSVVTAQRVQKRVCQPLSTSTTDNADNTLKSAQNLFSSDNIKTLQEQDKQYANLLNYFKSGTLPDGLAAATQLLKQQSEYFLHDGILYHVWVQPGKGHKSGRSHVQVVIPSQLIPTVLSETHDSPLLGGHMGINRTMDKTRQRFFWPTMYQDIVQWIKSCTPCNRRKRPSKPVRAQLIPMPVPSTPFERVSTDILGPLPTCQNTENKYVLVFIDNFTKYMELIAVPDIKADRIATCFLKEIVCRHGTPAYLHSDRGTNYLSNIVKATCQILGVTKTQTSSYHPQCNGQSERCMSYILEALSKRLERHHDTWDQHLPFVQYVYNTTPCLDSTGYSPSFLLHGRVLKSPVDIITPELPDPPRSAQQYVAKLLHVLEVAHEDAVNTMKERKQQMVTKASDKTHDPDFHVGDTVYLHHPVLSTGQSAKLMSPWSGPHYIVQKFSSIHVQLRRYSDNSLLPGRIHINRLKKVPDRQPDTNVTNIQDDVIPNDGNACQQPHVNDSQQDTVPTVDNNVKLAKDDDPNDKCMYIDLPKDKKGPIDDDDIIQDYYEVEKIVAKRRHGDEWQYRVKWLTFPSQYNSWVDLADLNPTCQSLVEKIHDILPTRKSKRKSK